MKKQKSMQQRSAEITKTNNRKSKSPYNPKQNNKKNGYVGAPYNFVPFYDKVYQYPNGKLTNHGSMEDNLVTGEITYEVTAETRIMIDDGTQQFFKDAKGRHAIPGSTMRGLIRNNVQVLGLCSYEDDIDDYALTYRNVAYGAEKKRYNDTLGRSNNSNKSYGVGVLLNVRAGYVVNEGGKFVIYQTAIDSIKKEFKEMNYYVLSERKIVNDYLKDGNKFSYEFFRQKGKSILQHEFEEFKHYNRNGRDHYKGTPNRKYKPYYMPVSYKVAQGKDIVAVGDPGKYEEEGYAVSTGKMNEKKAVYIIPQIDKNKKSITIPEDDVRAFRIDLKKKENTLKQFGGKEYFDLPEEGEKNMRPVFYIWLDNEKKKDGGGRLYFGFTPMLRLFYDHTVKEGLRQEWETGKVDYAKALFGYASKEESYKSKISFSDAVLLGEKVRHGEEQELVLAEPKPTSYLDYLKQNENGTVTYNTDGFELRGAKQYWLHRQVILADAPRNKNAASTISPLEAGAKFEGKIRFQNLTEDELGLLLWAVRLNEGSQMNVGKAKAYGYGRISVKIKEAKKLDMQKAYKSEETLCLNPFCDIEIDKAIESYKKEIKKYLGDKTIDELPHIQDFFAMKDSNYIPDDRHTRYMELGKEYQSRNKQLPSINAIVRRK